MLLEWQEDEDNEGNTTYQAESQIHDDGDPFHWRINPALLDNRVYYNTHESDREVIGSSIGSYESPDAAKAECQRLEDEAVANARAHA